ncbi:sulfate adenylyltransferase [Klebsiella pneumoniae]|uniref:Sulfate adenylyltransferase n=1 Tax=Klebsiella pneumoniae TaxID=573 RepID=A0A3S4GDD3_KLEPN|nr:sulfate adenylyltransferase [Klebsiella pneumoniae]
MNTTIAQQIANEGGVEAYLHAQQHKSLLRFLTCGSVDDGKKHLNWPPAARYAPDL